MKGRGGTCPVGQAQPQISSRARSAGLVPQAPLPSSPLPCTLNSLGGGDDTGMPVRARGDESHSDVLLPKVWSPQPRTALREGQRGSRAPTGELSQSEILRNARKLLRYSSGWSWRQLSTTGGSTQEPRVSGAGHSSSQDTGVTAAGFGSSQQQSSEVACCHFTAKRHARGPAKAVNREGATDRLRSP